MTRRINSQRLPDAPASWDASSKEAWRSLISTLENSELFDPSRRTLPDFIVTGSISASVTLEVGSASLHELRIIVARLIMALNDSNYISARNVP
jgi:hypothetical protein